MMRAGMMSYDETMAWGAAQYRDVLDRLEEEGLPATFTQTGGMCAAIKVQLETGHTLLITDAEDHLSWARVEHEGWWVGLYEPGEHSDGPLAYGQVDGGDIAALLPLVGDVMFRRQWAPIRGRERAQWSAAPGGGRPHRVAQPAGGPDRLIAVVGIDLTGPGSQAS